MRIPALILIVLLTAGCPRSGSVAAGGTDSAGGQAASQSKPDKTRIAMVISATESDPWSTELLNALGASLGFDPWSKPGESGHLDTYGPYDGRLGDREIEIQVSFAGLNSVADLLSQQALGEEARLWAEAQKPALVWLDGDQANFVTGMHLDPKIPIIFTGTVGEQDLYYDSGRDATGVYKRYSLPGVMGEIWKSNKDAQRIALVCDSSPVSATNLAKFKEQLDIVLPKEYPALICDPVKSWADLRSLLLEQQTKQDAIVVCGLGDEFSTKAIRENPPSPDLMKDITIPVISLGPSPMDHSGAVSVSLLPATHVKYALDSAKMVLGGKPAHVILSVTPPEMDVFRSDS